MKRGNPIFVTGIERSGSSIVAKIIRYSGAWTGIVNAMEENEAWKVKLQTYFRYEIGCDPAGQYPLPSANYTIYNTFGNRFENVFENEMYDGHSPWMIKSSKLGLLWKQMHRSYPTAKWVIVRRRTGDVLYSCCKTAFMNAFKIEANCKAVGAANEREGWLWWVKKQEENFTEMVAAGLNCKIVWPDRIANGDWSQIKEMLEWLELPFDEQLLKEEIEHLIRK